MRHRSGRRRRILPAVLCCLGAVFLLQSGILPLPGPAVTAFAQLQAGLQDRWTLLTENELLRQRVEKLEERLSAAEQELTAAGLAETLAASPIPAPVLGWEEGLLRVGAAARAGDLALTDSGALWGVVTAAENGSALVRPVWDPGTLLSGTVRRTGETLLLRGTGDCLAVIALPAEELRTGDMILEERGAFLGRVRAMEKDAAGRRMAVLTPAGQLGERLWLLPGEGIP